jgi:hypothetical protein
MGCKCVEFKKNHNNTKKIKEKTDIIKTSTEKKDK